MERSLMCKSQRKLEARAIPPSPVHPGPSAPHLPPSLPLQYGKITTDTCCPPSHPSLLPSAAFLTSLRQHGGHHDLLIAKFNSLLSV